jgi:hypothetical protein
MSSIWLCCDLSYHPSLDFLVSNSESCKGRLLGFIETFKTLEPGLPVDVGGMNLKSIVDGVAQKVVA